MASILEGRIDFEGQKLAETLTSAIIATTSVAAFATGMYTNSVINEFIVFGVGLVAALLVCIPPWSVYNKNPVKFLASRKELEKAKEE